MPIRILQCSSSKISLRTRRVSLAPAAPSLPIAAPTLLSGVYADRLSSDHVETDLFSRAPLCHRVVCSKVVRARLSPCLSDPELRGLSIYSFFSIFSATGLFRRVFLMTLKRDVSSSLLLHVTVLTSKTRPIFGHSQASPSFRKQ